MSEIMKINSEYSDWINDISLRFKSSQIKAAIWVNREMLLFYWSIGHDISELHNESKYGKSFYKNLSQDLQTALPDVKSFSVTNLKYMKYFYEMYHTSNRQQLVDDFENMNHQQVVDECIFMIPWGHHIQIINKCKGNTDKALFFVKKTYENNWSRNVLLNFLDTGLYEREGKAITNFEKLLPDVGSDLAKEITKDPYNFDFLKQLQWQAYESSADMPDDLCFLEGKYLEDYLHDVVICQQFARRSREKMAEIILERTGMTPGEAFHTIHNYIDTDEMILRKGAIAAHSGEKVLIPINMRDGSVLAVGKGNPEWNYSAPHGAGRLMSRTKAKENLSMDEYRETMKGIYTTSINESTLDEAPMAYKSLEDIIDVIRESVDVIDVMKPIYNFKASD